MAESVRERIRADLENPEHSQRGLLRHRALLVEAVSDLDRLQGERDALAAALRELQDAAEDWRSGYAFGSVLPTSERRTQAWTRYRSAFDASSSVLAAIDKEGE